MEENVFDYDDAQFEPDVSDDVEEVEFEVEEDVVEEVVAPVVKTVLDTDEWKAAIKSLKKAGYDVSAKDGFSTVRAALVEFQRANGIAGMSEGHLTEATVALLEA